MSETKYFNHRASRTALDALMYSASHDDAATARRRNDDQDTGVCHDVKTNPPRVEKSSLSPAQLLSTYPTRIPLAVSFFDAPYSSPRYRMRCFILRTCSSPGLSCTLESSPSVAEMSGRVHDSIHLSTPHISLYQVEFGFSSGLHLAQS